VGYRAPKEFTAAPAEDLYIAERLCLTIVASHSPSGLVETAKQPGFSATQTVWRRMQSAANPSPLEFPANREKYREFLYSWYEFMRPHLISATFLGVIFFAECVRDRPFVNLTPPQPLRSDRAGRNQSSPNPKAFNTSVGTYL